jgi:hypothetical protein
VFTTVAADEPSLEAVMEIRTESSTEEMAPELERSALSVFGFAPFEPDIGRSIAKGDAKEKLLQHLGKPNPTDRVRSTIQWGRGGYTQTKYWYYDGLEIWLDQPAGASRTWIQTIILRSGAYKLKFGLSIGTKKSQFLATLGPPYRTPTPQSLLYSSHYYGSEDGVPVASHSKIEIFFDQEDRAERIVWKYFVD